MPFHFIINLLFKLFHRRQNELQLIVGTSMTSRIKPDAVISGVYVHPTIGEIIGFCEKDDTIRKIDPKTGVTTTLISSYNITCLAILNNGHITVGVRDHEDSGGRLFLYTRSGKRISHNDLVPVPLQIAVSRLKDIIAVTTEKKVLVMDHGLQQVIHVYITDQEAGIHTAVFDNHDELLVEDETYDVIHVIDISTGWKKHTIKHNKIGKVWTMGATQGGALWIGSKEERIVRLLGYHK